MGNSETGGKRRLIKRIVVFVLSVLFLTSTAVVGISVYAGNALLHPEREAIRDTPGEFGLSYTDVEFESSLDGALLQGWWVPAQRDGKVAASPKTVIFSHGYGDCRDMSSIGALNLAVCLAAEGYNILLFDYRDSGESGGNLTTVGHNEKYDMLSAISLAKNLGSEKIAILGWSMGASVAITAGTESPHVYAIIADSPFADLTDYLKSNLQVWSELPSVPFTPVIMTVLPALSGVDPESVSPSRSVAGLGGRGLLLIHGKADKAIPYTDSEKIFDAAPNKENAELWEPEGAGHVQSYKLYRDEYEERVKHFLAKHLA
ncbi:MAG: alpha/beta hydrolase [Oscillospiraceae bacterium]